MAHLLFRFIGQSLVVQSLVEPKIMASNRHNNNIFHHHQQNSNFILTYSQYTNLAICIFLFFILAIEVIFVKIVTAINLDVTAMGRDHGAFPTTATASNIEHDMDLLNNNFNYINNNLNNGIDNVAYPMHQRQ